MSVAVEDPAALLSLGLRGLNHGDDVFLDFSNWYIAFKFFSLGVLQAFLAALSDLVHVDALSVSQAGHLLSDLASTGVSTSGNESPVDALAEVFLELFEVPAVHGLKTELLLEHRVNVEKTGLVVTNINDISLVSCENDGIESGAVLLECVDLLSSLRESN